MCIRDRGNPARWFEEGSDYDYKVLATVTRDSSGLSDINGLEGPSPTFFDGIDVQTLSEFSNPYVGQIPVGSAVEFVEEVDAQGTKKTVIKNFPGWPALDSADPNYSPSYGDVFWNGGSGILDNGYVYIYEKNHDDTASTAQYEKTESVFAPNMGIYKIKKYNGPGQELEIDETFNKFARHYKVDQETPYGYSGCLLYTSDAADE